MINDILSFRRSSSSTSSVRTRCEEKTLRPFVLRSLSAPLLSFSAQLNAQTTFIHIILQKEKPKKRNLTSAGSDVTIRRKEHSLTLPFRFQNSPLCIAPFFIFFLFGEAEISRARQTRSILTTLTHNLKPPKILCAMALYCHVPPSTFLN
jgi:hypothetical protein